MLARVRDGADTDAWQQFHALYAPLLYRYARARGLSRADAEEVRDQCLLVVSRKIPDFEYDKRKGGFKNWLYRIASGKVIDWLRKRRECAADTRLMAELRDPGPAPDEVWERHWKNQHLRYCVEQIHGTLSESVYQAFHLLVFEECSVDEVCERLDMNANQVYKAKSRVLKRIREKLAELDGGPGTCDLA